MANKTVTDMFQAHIGAHEYDDFVTKMIRWYYDGNFAKVAWCAISMSYMMNQLGLLDQIGGKNQNCYEMLKDVTAAVKKTGKGRLTMRENLKKGQTVKRGAIIFILNDEPPMRVTSKKHVTSANKDFVYKGTGTFESLGGNQSDEIMVKSYAQSRIYAIFEPEYEAEKKPTPEPTPVKKHSTLRKGDKGAEVKEMQTALRKLGFANITGKEMVVDGSYGKITTATVTAFQTICGLRPDGICGTKQTWPMIDKLLAMPKTRVTALTTVNVRTGPGAGFKKIGTVEEGKAVTYATLVDGWIYIPLLKGWSKSSYYTIPPMTESSPS